MFIHTAKNQVKYELINTNPKTENPERLCGTGVL